MTDPRQNQSPGPDRPMRRAEAARSKANLPPKQPAPKPASASSDEDYLDLTRLGLTEPELSDLDLSGVDLSDLDLSDLGLTDLFPTSDKPAPAAKQALPPKQASTPKPAPKPTPKPVSQPKPVPTPVQRSEPRDTPRHMPSEEPHPRKRKLTAGTVIGRILLVILSFVLVTVIGAYAVLHIICKGPSPAASDTFVSTIMETGALKFLARVYFSEEEILEITGRNKLSDIQDTVDPGLIGTPSDNPTPGGDEPFDINGVELHDISGRTFVAKLLIVNDPSRVRLATIYPWGESSSGKQGWTLDKLVNEWGYLAGVNGGEYESSGNWGGRPKGLVVCAGEIQFNSPQKGDVLVGMTEDNILMITDIGNMTTSQVEALVREKGIRDAVSFKDIDDGDDNHFTKLIINGNAREITGAGSGANPRTVIGQRADGAILLLTTDGRGAAGHLGATARDLIAIMEEYGAVNAANLDGGSSSAMYYDGHYEQSSVTFYYSTSSWRLPTAFVVERREDD